MALYGRQRSRQAAGILMLAVWVFMFSVQVLHRHTGPGVQQTACYECAHHIKHPVHYSIGARHFGDCLICQSAMVPFLCPGTFSSPCVCGCNCFSDGFSTLMPEGNVTYSHSRAPPAAFIF